MFSGTTGTGTNVVIHVLAEETAVEGDSHDPGYLPGFGPVPSTLLRDLAAVAKVKPLVTPRARPEPGYRPSAALAEFIRFRDLTCRFPECDQPAEVCDIDHTVPFPLGPTHPSNLKLLCRYHHLLKTFYSDWQDRQEPDGTLTWTSPSGHTYTTKPYGALLFPALAIPTGTLTLPTNLPPPERNRGVMMPVRRRTRAGDRAARIGWERGINEARMSADPPPF